MQRLRGLCVCLIFPCLLLTILSACGRNLEDVDASEEINVYASFYPIYALTSMIVEDVPDLQFNCLVQPQDGCLRSYALSDWDAALLASADLVLVGGQGLERFASALETLEDEDGPALVELMYNMDLQTFSAENADPDGDSHWLDANPHIYMSIDGAIEIVGRAAQSLALLDPRYEELYRMNLQRAEERLRALQAEIHAELEEFEGERVAVLNEAFAYVAEEYGLNAALYWDRESGETLDANALKTLLEALREQKIQVVLLEKQAPKGLTDALTDAGIAVAKLDTLSTCRADEGSEGYFAAQRANAAAVCTAYLSISEADA